MYKVIKDGESIGLIERPTFIKQQRNGCFVLCPEPEASGIAFEGKVYHLLDRDNIEDVDTVILVPTDSGKELDLTQQTIDDADAMNVDQEYRLVLLELGLTDDTVN